MNDEASSSTPGGPAGHPPLNLSSNPRRRVTISVAVLVRLARDCQRYPDQSLRGSAGVRDEFTKQNAYARTFVERLAYYINNTPAGKRARYDAEFLKAIGFDYLLSKNLCVTDGCINPAPAYELCAQCNEAASRAMHVGEELPGEPDLCIREGCNNPAKPGEACDSCLSFAYGVADTIEEAREQGVL